MPNYLKHYENLCATRKLLNRCKSDGIYYECHHIIPKSLGGTNDASNKVLLTAKEHYIAHLLLYNHYKNIGGNELRKMAFALVSMASTNANHNRIILTSNQYKTIKEAAALSKKGKKIENTKNYKKPKSQSHKNAIRLARLNAPARSIETRKKLSNIKKGISPKQNFYTTKCPYCNITGQLVAMKRWHFNNCKKKEVKNA